VKSILILDSEGKRLVCKHYTKDAIKDQKEQKAFDTKLFNKTQGANSEIILLDDVTIVYKAVQEVYFYVIGSNSENELLLLSVLDALVDALSSLVRGALDKRSLMENLDLTLLTLDEIIDDGIVFETDPTEIASRVTMKGLSGPDSLPITEQTIGQALSAVREQVTKSLLK